MTPRQLFISAALLSALALAMGAFGSHILKNDLSPDLFKIWETAARYHGIQSIGLFAAAWSADRWPGERQRFAGVLLLSGQLVFCGSLYTMALSGVRWLGAITPLGGLMMITGWLLLAYAVFRADQATR